MKRATSRRGLKRAQPSAKAKEMIRLYGWERAMEIADENENSSRDLERQYFWRDVGYAVDELEGLVRGSADGKD